MEQSLQREQHQPFPAARFKPTPEVAHLEHTNLGRRWSRMQSRPGWSVAGLTISHGAL
jgi:hypothetical protein